MKWPLVPIEECVSIVGGSTPSTSVSAYWGGEIRWATPKDLSDLGGTPFISDTPRKITQAGLKNSGAEVLPAGSVLFSSRAPIGLVAVNRIPMATNQGFKSFVPKPDKIEPMYLYYWLRANRTRLQAMGNGATFKELSKAAVARLRIPLPPLDEQRRIAAILDQADSLRAKRREAIARLDALTQSIFIEMFGDPVTNPKHWPESSLSEACSKITDGTHHSPPIVSDGIPYITAKHIGANGIDFFSNPWFVPVEHHREIVSRCDPRPGDVLYIKDGVTTGTAAVNCYDFEFSMLSSLALLRPKPGVCSGDYLCAYLNNPRIKERMLQGMAGAAIRRLTLVKIRRELLVVPPIELQDAYSERIEAYRQTRAHMTWSEKHLMALFASLQHSAFRGEH